MKQIKVGVIGVGKLGEQHARIYAQLPQIELVGVVDTDRKRAIEVAEKYNTVAFFNHRDLCDKVEAVSIVVPTDLHHILARDFLHGGINVLLEKPITRTVEEAEDLLSLSRSNQVVLQIGHVERYNKAVIELEKRINRPRFIESHRLGPFLPRGIEVGVVLDLMIHDLEIILHLVKSEIERIDAVGVKVLSPFEDIANARITFTDGCVANITASRVSQERLRKIRIFQEDAYFSLDYINQEFSIYRKQDDVIVREDIRPGKEESLQLELADFIQCVCRRREPLVPGERGKEVLRVALDIIRQVGTDENEKSYCCRIG